MGQKAEETKASIKRANGSVGKSTRETETAIGCLCLLPAHPHPIRPPTKAQVTFLLLREAFCLHTFDVETDIVSMAKRAKS